MFLSKKTTKLSPKNRAIRRKKANSFLMLFGFIITGVFASSQSIRAQIGNIYDEQSEQVAGISALMSAVTNNDVNGVRFFSKAGRALINQKNFGGATALHMASREGNFEIAKILVDSGADVNLLDNEGWTPLMRASLAANKNIVDLLLLKGAQANAINSVGESAIIHATSSDCNDCLNAMFEKYNFMKFMETKLLKEQLSDAFIIARNRDNQVAQGLLESYLDTVIKMTPLMKKDEAAQPPLKITMGTLSDSMVKKQDDKRMVVTEIPEKKNKVVPVTKNESSDSNGITRFKFIVGPVGQKAKVESSDHKKSVPHPHHKSKNSDDCNCDEKTTKKETAKEVINLADDSSKKYVTHDGNNIFKFSQGEPGKVVKHKIVKKPAPAEPQAVVPQVAPAPVAKSSEQKVAEQKVVTAKTEQKVAEQKVVVAKEDLKAAKEDVKVAKEEVKTAKEDLKAVTPSPSTAAPAQQKVETAKPSSTSETKKKPLSKLFKVKDDIEKSIIIDLSKKPAAPTPSADSTAAATDANK